MLTFTDLDLRANDLRIPPVGAVLIDCARACWRVGSLPGGASSDIQVLLACFIARCGPAVSAFTDFVLRVNNLQIPPVKAVLAHCACAYSYA